MDNIKLIEQKIKKANKDYHTFGISDLSDEEYDSLKDRLKILDPNNNLFKIVGSKVESKSSDKMDHWEKINHGDYKMGSQNKITNNDQLIQWCNKNINDNNIKFITQHKMDGISIKLIYIDGILKHAITRGCGSIGEDIYRNVIKMKNVPKKINVKGTVLIRGEIVLKLSDLEFVGGKNARNSAAGAAKKLDGSNCEHLSVIVYDIINWKDLLLDTVEEMVKLLKSWNFDVVTTYNCKDYTEIDNIMKEYIKEKRKNLDWLIDGLVIKNNKLQNDKWDYPEHTIAYKFPSDKAVTKLKDVIWQDSGGRINPVAILEPIDINGTTVSKATLNNIEHIKSLGIKIGDLVVVSRRNDVIPCVEGVSISDPNGKEIKPPTHDEDGFPIIHATNSNGDKLVYLISSNPNSKSKKIRQILAWYNAHDTKGVAEETIDTIYDNGIATDLPSFIKVGLNGHPDLIDLDGFGVGKFKILNKATRQTIETDLIKFLNGIDISGFGSSRFEAICNHFNKELDLDSFINICFSNDLNSITGFSDLTIKALQNGIKEKIDLIDKLKVLVKINSWHPEKIINNHNISGKSFCFTGKMTKERGDLENMVKKNGGIVSGVNKNLDYLVTNDQNSGSSKNEKATKLGIKKITEEEFIQMIEKHV